MTEDELQKLVIERCTDLGLLYFHSSDSRRDLGAGFPDLVIVGHGLLFRELKSESGSVSAQQSRWGRAIGASGSSWDVWRPVDWEAGRIQRELRLLIECPYSLAS